jgi:hypothetical protein
MVEFQDCFFGFYFEYYKKDIVSFQECFFGFYFEFIT